MLSGPFFQITLPLMVTFVVAIWAASWSQNKRLDDIIGRLTKLEEWLKNHESRISILEGSKWR